MNKARCITKQQLLAKLPFTAIELSKGHIISDGEIIAHEKVHLAITCDWSVVKAGNKNIQQPKYFDNT